MRADGARPRDAESTMHEMTVGHYLLRRLEEAGLEHMFGVPADSPPASALRTTALRVRKFLLGALDRTPGVLKSANA